MRARDIKPGMGLIFDDLGRSYHAIALDRPRRHLNRWTLNDRSETYKETRKTINPVTGKLYNIKVVKHKVDIMLTTGDKVYLRPSEIKVLRSK